MRNMGGIRVPPWQPVPRAGESRAVGPPGTWDNYARARPSLRPQYRASSTSASSILRSLTSISKHGISDFRSPPAVHHPCARVWRFLEVHSSSFYKSFSLSKFTFRTFFFIKILRWSYLQLIGRQERERRMVKDGGWKLSEGKMG